MKRMGYWK